MAFTKETEIDSIKVIGKWKKLEVRESIVVYEDGVQIAKTPHSKVINPLATSASLAQEHSDVQQVANSLWTTQHKTDFENFVSASDGL